MATTRGRIAVVGPAFPYKGGGAHHTTELAHRLAAAGHEVVLESWRAQYPGFLYPGTQTISEPEGEPFPGTRHRLDWRRPDGWWRTGRSLRSCDLVVLAVLSPVQVPAYLGILAGVGRRTPAVALCHNVLPHERKPYDVPLMKRLLRRADGVLVHSAAQADLARGLTDRPVRFAEMPAHLPGGHAEGAGRPAGHGDGKVHRRLLFFGMVRPYKGLDVLLRALAAGPGDVALTVAGEFWGGLDETEELVRTLGLEGRVDLRPGYVPAADVPGLFAAADALVLPYRSATASQNVWMAHEHGVPVIATDVGGFAGQVRDGVDGVICAPDDVAALTGALERFYAPGEPERLRSGVRPVDHGPMWTAYLDALAGGAVR
ncbi:glycosyltransferase family 4 protein [Actinomadura roseirufa]|uniref:glycosyltransferase family 4 protein n=1 Tax=Actinomadura roseirufa TaxID=2094049 RepID=UPI0010417F64|nr:glycosyltransferase family 4 protein [Actinomadura roseirufa]